MDKYDLGRFRGVNGEVDGIFVKSPFWGGFYGFFKRFLRYYPFLYPLKNTKSIFFLQHLVKYTRQNRHFLRHKIWKSSISYSRFWKFFLLREIGGFYPHKITNLVLVSSIFVVFGGLVEKNYYAIFIYFVCLGSRLIKIGG